MISTTISKIIAPLINDLGYELWGLEYLPQGANSLLRVYIDKPGGISISDCELISRRISSLIDVEDPIGKNYNLEISSPGIRRRLFNSAQYQRYLGEDIAIKLNIPLEGQRNLKGTIAKVNTSFLTLQVDGLPLEIPFSRILRANLISE